ncbi:MAG: Flp pilus assembly complex ATPase component TadA [Actinomycetota bacterium]|nr:Flp pilus assembly complex ATPase component TadA [Actinomycetota bacterium]
MSTVTRKLADVLLEQRLVGPDDLERAQTEQRRSGQPLSRVLVELGLLTEAGLGAALARHLDLEFADLSDRQIDAVAAALVPEQLARRHCALPIGFDDAGRLIVAMSDPSNVVALDDIRTVTDRKLQPVVATRADIIAAIDRYARMGDAVEQVTDQLEGGDDEATDLAELKEVVDEAPIVKFVNALISKAVQDRASDIHVEPQEHDLRVRYRVDGVLHEVTAQSRKIHAGVVSRLKIMADMDIAERRIPQDGRISLKTAGRAVDLRVSTLPTVYGEKVVMRILDKSSVLLELADLGFLDHNYARYEASFRKPYGMILVTGPTGSGKSTTLYATLNIINRPEVNIVTVEDPVEYRLAGISQVQVQPKAGLTFASALRSILRQDPDVVLVGEMRDHETAQMGMEAALTGHMVLSTLHTNDAPSAVTRLTEMGIDPFLVASAVDCVLAQRLARRLCPKCKEAYEPTANELTTAGLPWHAGDPFPTLYRAVGCAACARTGYRGRLAVHEVLPVSEEIERLVVERASTDDIAKFARAQGMRTLREDGLVKVLLGQTTLEEIARVVA